MDFLHYFFGTALGFVFMLLAGEALFCFKLKRRKCFLLRILPATTLLIAFPWLLTDTYRNSFFYIGDWFTTIFLVIFIASLLIIWLSFKIPFSKALFFGVGAYVLQHFEYNFRRFYTLILTDAGLLTGGDNYAARNLLSLAVAALIYLAFYFFFVRRYERTGSVVIKSTPLLVFMSVSLSMIYILSWWTTEHDLNNVSVYLYTAAVCLLLMIIQFGLFYGTKMQSDKQVIEQMFGMQARQQQISAENIDVINMKCHDLKHQIAALRRSTDAEEKAGLLDELEGAVMIYDSVARTGSDALDVVITEKSLYCEKHGIRFTYVVDGSKLAIMSKNDIYSLFGNLLDNAIESVMKLEEDKRIISMSVGLRGNILVIHADNSFSGSLTFVNGLPVTTKNDVDYHGFGTRSIRFIAEKYGGNAVMRTVEDRFCLDVILPYKADESSARASA